MRTIEIDEINSKKLRFLVEILPFVIVVVFLFGSTIMFYSIRYCIIRVRFLFRFKLHKGYEQWGMFHGEIQINGLEPTEVNLSGLKKRFWSSGTKDFASMILFSDSVLASFSTSEK